MDPSMYESAMTVCERREVLSLPTLAVYIYRITFKWILRPRRFQSTWVELGLRA